MRQRVLCNWCDAAATRAAAVQSGVTAAKGDYPIIVARWAVGRPLHPPPSGYASLRTPIRCPFGTPLIITFSSFPDVFLFRNNTPVSKRTSDHHTNRLSTSSNIRVPANDYPSSAKIANAVGAGLVGGALGLRGGVFPGCNFSPWPSNGWTPATITTTTTPPGPDQTQ